MLAWDEEVTKAQELGQPPSTAVQQVQILGNTDACAAPVQERKIVPLLTDSTNDDVLGDDEAEGDYEADGKDEAEDDEDQAEQKEEENDTGEVNDAKDPREQAVITDVYDPEKSTYQCEPLTNKSQITFKITSQAVVNVLYDMDPWDMRKAVCGAIKKKRNPTRDFSGTSYLSEISMLQSGDLSAITYNEKQGDISLLSQMSDWDKDIIDHEIGTNFGTRWCYRIHMKGVKESSLSRDIGPRRQKAALIRQLVRTNTTTLTSLRIHHIREVYYSQGSGEGNEAVVVEFFDIEQAHAALSRGLSYNGKHFDCETPDKDRFLARCGYCQAYGHNYGACSRPPRCGKCAGRHRTRYCKSQHEKCALCDGCHASNSSTCPVKIAEENSVVFAPVLSSRPQTAVDSETVMPTKRSSNNQDTANHDAQPHCGNHQDTLKLLNEIRDLQKSLQDPKASVKAKSRNNKNPRTRERRAPLEPLRNGGSNYPGRSAKSRNVKKPRTRKRQASLEPLTNGGLNDPGRSAKRVKQEEQQETKTMDLYTIPSPYIVHRD